MSMRFITLTSPNSRPNSAYNWLKALWENCHRNLCFVSVFVCVCVCVCVCACICVWRILVKSICQHYQLQHTSLTLYLLPAGHTLLRRAGAGDKHLAHLANIWIWNNTMTASSAHCSWQVSFTQHNHHSLSTGLSPSRLSHIQDHNNDKHGQQCAAHLDKDRIQACPVLPILIPPIAGILSKSGCPLLTSSFILSCSVHWVASATCPACFKHRGTMFSLPQSFWMPTTKFVFIIMCCD